MENSQKRPSIWMCVAILQSCLWFFTLPRICRTYWYLFSSYSNETAEFIINLTPSIFYCGYCILVLPIYYIQHPFFEQYKIQDKTWPWLHQNEKVRKAFWTLTKRSLRLAAVNLFLLAPLLSFMKIRVVAMLGFEGPSFATDAESWPSHRRAFHDVILLSLIHEFGFYSSHRLMHSQPFLYRYHKIHHEYKENIAIAAQHNHFIDFILSIALPALLALSIVQCHSVTQFQWTLWTMYANLDDHVGYSFPWSPVRWFPLAALTDEHEFHHSRNLGCFGSKLSIFNSIFGGYEHYSTKGWKKERNSIVRHEETKER